MKLISASDLTRWKENSLDLASRMNYDNSVLEKLEKTKLRVITKRSGRSFYGWAKFVDNSISVYGLNPSRHFPRRLWEVWNQSGMDHELIGHLYRDFRYGARSEREALETQISFAIERGEEDHIWRVASKLIVPVSSLKTYF